MKNEYFLTNISKTKRVNRYFKLSALTILLLSICNNYNLFSQQENPVDKDPKVSISDASYVDKLNPGQYATFTMDYKVNSNLFLTLRGELRSHGFVQVFKVPLMAKQYVTKQFYVLGGGEIEITRNLVDPRFLSAEEGEEFENAELEIENSRNDSPKPYSAEIYFKYGFGYEVNSNFSLEATQELFFNSDNFGAYSNPNMFSLKGKFKF
ncbi:hypothetical protein D1816_03875 [Aquimarina sp. AD10]|uniref:hypothetical protein n=1 Tax=Aquimarina sp. AD10 TaxID=1714849 RepID=UPI000E4CCC00|nr:hypothetical protein [Aquimarina sp. AD10]AXT59526.1 hypothetical protein D1816_03875 [Aquimarina sp. AD10]RKN00427.1 hypothetical protein D7033_08705 [Aquimarina sp. AD10]